MTDAARKPSVAIVTGAGGDIGRAIALALGADGFAVLAADIDAEAAEVTAEAVRAKAGTDSAGIRTDVTNPASVASMAEAARGLGAVSALVNNAGGVTGASVNATEIADWQRDLALNLEAAFVCFKQVAEDLKVSGGALINIASVNGLGVYGHPGYSAAKAGLIRFTKSVAVEYGKFGIRANAIAPGSVQTQAWQARAAANPDIFTEIKRWYPLQRIAASDDVASAVSFLVSSRAAAITGVCLPVDCGLTAGQTELARAFSQSNDY